VSEFRTERLDLLPLTLVRLRGYLEHTDRLEEELRFSVSRSILSPRVLRAIRMKLAKMELAGETRHIWYTYWLIVIRSIPFGAGLAGYKGFPGQNGEVEIGYGIDPEYRGRGYMTEAVKGMIRWAFGEPACRTIVALEVEKSNVASRRVLEKAGMTQFAESDTSLSFKIKREGEPGK
jgi:ribosomal-protein-alanine N-acetyltransferase